MTIFFRKSVSISVLLLAISAASAAGANAATLTVSPYVTATATDTGASHGALARLTIGAGGRYVECTEDGFNVAVPLVGLEELEVSPTIGGCFSNGITSVPTTVKMNGCSYEIQFPGTTSAETTLQCPVGKQVEIHIYENATKHTEGKAMCILEIGGQGPIAGAIALSSDGEGTATESLTAAISLKEIAATNTVGSAGLCGIAAGNTGTVALKGTAAVSAALGGVPWALMVG